MEEIKRRNLTEPLPSKHFFTQIQFPLHIFIDPKGRPVRCKGTDAFPREEDIDFSDNIPMARCRGGCNSSYPAHIGRTKVNNLFKGWQWSKKPLPNKP